MTSELTPMPNDQMPYILESAEFDNYVYGKGKAAQSEIDQIDVAIRRLQAEIDSRLVRRHDLMKIVIKAEALMNMKDVSPNAPKFTEVEAA